MAYLGNSKHFGMAEIKAVEGEARKSRLGRDSEGLCVLKLRNRNLIQNVMGSN